MEMMKIHNPQMTVEDINRLLTELDLLQFKREKLKNFSTGMKQRLAFAMCLAAKPDVLLLDEPFSGLDIEGKLLMRETINRVKEEGGQMAVIISSHLIHDIEEVASKVGIVKNGRLLDEQDVDKLQVKYKNLESYFMDKTMRLKEGGA